jgi:hypothetical protein
MSRITTGWLARHTPQGPGGRQAALIDIAQDLLLAQLCQQGIFDHLVFKGGTALRKLYAGNVRGDCPPRRCSPPTAPAPAVPAPGVPTIAS